MIVNSHIVPELNTTLIEPLNYLEQSFLKQRTVIEDWFKKQWELTTPPIYGSVDLRNAGFKLAPIDMNLFPAGFNNLNPNHMTISVQAAKKIILKTQADTQRILVIPEQHTRNFFYWENINTLKNILEQAGFDIRLGMLEGESQVLNLPSGSNLELHAIKRIDDKLEVENFKSDLILLNNDLSEGIPDILQNLKTKIVPPAELGWSHRLKSDHFQYYAEVVDDFAKATSIDPWLIAPLFEHCGHIDFMQQEGMQCLIDHAEQLFKEIKNKYDHYHIPYQPFLVVKADAGTYGMAVMTVRNIDELKNMNRKQRTRMAKTKGGQSVNRVIIQEGVYTFETIGQDQAVAEPVVYLMGCQVVGGFYRVHKERGVDENLNSPGMSFEPIAFSQPCNEPCRVEEPNACQNRLYIYGIIARLSMLAAAREMQP